jgi:phage tail sheath protein FI
MPVTPRHPGVYIEEIPSDVRTIIGVSTSDTAFVDFFSRGPTDRPTRITSLPDFQRTFGGLDARSEASYAIQQYFLNGGQVAWVVRVATERMRAATVALPSQYGAQPALELEASSVGTWGDALRASVDYAGLPLDRGLFNLTIQQVATVGGRERVVATETHRGLNMNKLDSRFVERVVEGASTLVRVASVGLGAPPRPTLAADPANPARLVVRPEPFKGGSDDPDLMDADGTPVDETDFNRAVRDALIGDPDGPAPESPPGIYGLARIAPFIFNILCLPIVSKLNPATRKAVVAAAQAFCRDTRAFLILDVPLQGTSRQTRRGPSPQRVADPASAEFQEIDDLRDRNAAVYYPPLVIADPLNDNKPLVVGASGTLAGLYARTDVERGVWKAPAGTAATLRGASLEHKLTDLENGGLNPLGVNVLRTFPIFGNVSWGARTLEGADQMASEWKYIPVRRTALFIEESLFQGLKWVVFEPNDEPLWSQIRLNVGAFMQSLFRQGAFQGQTRREAYFVKCDRETTTQTDINAGIVNVVVGFAPLKPAEFVVIQLQQMAGQIQT